MNAKKRRLSIKGLAAVVCVTAAVVTLSGCVVAPGPGPGWRHRHRHHSRRCWQTPRGHWRCAR